MSLRGFLPVNCAEDGGFGFNCVRAFGGVNFASVCGAGRRSSYRDVGRIGNALAPEFRYLDLLLNDSLL